MIKFLLARNSAKQKGSRFPAPFLLRAGAEGKQRRRRCTQCNPHFLSRERKRASPVQKKGVPHCKRAARRTAMLAESGAYQAVYLNDLTIFYLRCRFACNSLPLRNLRLLWICADLLLPAKAALLGLAAICALSIAGDYTAPKQDSRAAADNRSRPNRIAVLMRLRRVQAFSFRRCQGHSSPRLPI